MKKLLTIILAVVLSTGFCSYALDVEKVTNVKQTDEMFMDMAVSAAKKSVASGGAPSGAVIILNGAWRSTGTPDGDKTAEESAVAKSRLTSLANAVIYTVNEPVTAVINLLEKMGANAIYFTNPRDAVIAAGVYPASDYNDNNLDSGAQIPLYLLPYSDAEALLK